MARPTGIGKPYYRQIGQEFHLGYLESSQLEAKILQLATWNLDDLLRRRKLGESDRGAAT